MIVSTLEDGTEEGRGSRSKKDDRDGTILGRIMFRVAVLNVFFGLKRYKVNKLPQGSCVHSRLGHCNP